MAYDAFMPDVATMDQCAGMRDARCLMHAASPLRYVGGVENWIGIRIDTRR